MPVPGPAQNPWQPGEALNEFADLQGDCGTIDPQLTPEYNDLREREFGAQSTRHSREHVRVQPAATDAHLVERRKGF